MVARPATTWAVYRHPADGASPGAMGVCRAAEWAGLDAARPGQLTLVRDDLPSEGQAERLARGTAGDPVPRANATGQAAVVRRARPVELNPAVAAADGPAAV